MSKKLRILGLSVSLLGMTGIASGQGKPATCLIVKHASAARQAFVSGASWLYVAGDFPEGMKWKSNIKDRDIRKAKAAGGRIVVVTQSYTAEDLKQAEDSCKN